MSEHTATPWRLSDQDPIVVVGPDGFRTATASGGQESGYANAALIVRAVNAHAGLMKAGDQMADWLQRMRTVAKQAAEEEDDRSLQYFILDTMPDGFLDTLNSISATLEAAKGESYEH